jgi:hypothetical protein
MVSLLRQLQAEWNTLVPAAQERGIPRVRRLNAPLETIAYRRGKLEWLKAQLLTSASFDTWTFAVEIECMLPASMSHFQIAALVTAAGVDCRAETYNHDVRTWWKVVTDGSLGNYQRGVELVSPILQGEDGFRQIRAVCRALAQAGAKITKKCGLHVHVGVARQPLSFFKRLARSYSSAQAAINTVLAPSRTWNTFCSPLRINQAALDAATNLNEFAYAVGQVPGLSNARSSSRYRAVNFMSFWQHETVEFRQHQGTIEAPKAENWVRLCLRMCQAAADGRDLLPTTLTELLDGVQATEAERTYFTNRQVYFAARTTRRAA